MSYIDEKLEKILQEISESDDIDDKMRALLKADKRLIILKKRYQNIEKVLNAKPDDQDDMSQSDVFKEIASIKQDIDNNQNLRNIAIRYSSIKHLVNTDSDTNAGDNKLFCVKMGHSNIDIHEIKLEDLL